MPHADSLISTLVAGFVLAFVFGMLANRLKLSPLVGYLVAGIAVGPHTIGFVADTTLAPQLAEIGVILLMFGVGLHFSPADLMKVRKVAIPGALVQIASATGLGTPLGHNAAERSLPLRDAFAVLFFVSVGMLFDPMILVVRPLSVLGVLGIVIVGKTLAALAITHSFGLDRATGLTVGASLAQVGEFSFILAAVGVSLGALRQETHDLILAAALLSISLNPFVFLVMDRLGGEPPNPRLEGEANPATA